MVGKRHAWPNSLTSSMISSLSPMAENLFLLLLRGDDRFPSRLSEVKLIGAHKKELKMLKI